MVPVPSRASYRHTWAAAVWGKGDNIQEEEHISAVADREVAE